MTVVVTTMPGGVAQVFNPDTGRITYKCKSERGAAMEIEALGGVVLFRAKGSSATVCGPSSSLHECDLVEEGGDGYAEAKKEAERCRAEFVRARISDLQKSL